MIAKDPAARWPTLSDAAEALLEGLGASDSQMRRDLATLLATLPDELGRRSLPPTPKSPTPATMPPEQAGTQAMVAAPRVQDIATQLMPETAMRPTPVMPELHVEENPAKRSRVLILGGLVTASIAVVAAIGVMSKDGTTAATVPAPTTDSAAVAATVAEDTLDERLDASDTNVVRIGLEPITATLRVGDSLLLKATAYGPSGEPIQRRMRWTSDDSKNVTVKASGWVIALAPTVGGPVPVTATTDKRSGVALITVK
jgi:hypothetical protein